MKRSNIRLGMAAVLSAVVTAAAPADIFAQVTPPAKIAIVEMQRVIRNSAAATDIKIQVDKRRQVYQNEITKQEQELREAQQELSRQATILAPEALAQKRREIDTLLYTLGVLGLTGQKREGRQVRPSVNGILR